MGGFTELCARCVIWKLDSWASGLGVGRGGTVVEGLYMYMYI